MAGATRIAVSEDGGSSLYIQQSEEPEIFVLSMVTGSGDSIETISITLPEAEMVKALSRGIKAVNTARRPNKSAVKKEEEVLKPL